MDRGPLLSPARICWLGLGERQAVGERLNELIAAGEIGPLALGRDHMDPASVASPWRETEAMRDGSHAIADWPVLGAMLHAAQGATWVAIGNGGGVGVGRSIHSAMVVVADGSERAARKIRRVFHADPALGVARYADAGYPEAIERACQADLDRPAAGRRHLSTGVLLALEADAILGSLMEYAVIGPDEILARKPFTDPELTQREAEVMREMLARERERAQAWTEEAGEHAGALIERSAQERERRHLLVVPDRRALLQANGLTAVGFFSRPREDVDQTVLFELEDELVTRMADYAPAGLLSYFDLEFVNGAYGNLVLFSTPDVPKEWSADAVHRRAVAISPSHYHEVRLHRGSIDGRLLDGGNLAIVSTKYFDFDSPTTWRCLRRFDLATEG